MNVLVICRGPAFGDERSWDSRDRSTPPATHAAR
jgi:hypothetical protein